VSPPTDPEVSRRQFTSCSEFFDDGGSDGLIRWHFVVEVRRVGMELAVAGVHTGGQPLTGGQSFEQVVELGAFVFV
jgi:hypothetical protein